MCYGFIHFFLTHGKHAPMQVYFVEQGLFHDMRFATVTFIFEFPILMNQSMSGTSGHVSNKTFTEGIN